MDVPGLRVHGQISAPISDESSEQSFTESSKHSQMCPINCIQGCPKHALPEQQHMEEDTELISSCSIDGIVEFMNAFQQTMKSYPSAKHDLQNIHQALHNTNEKGTSRNLKLEHEDLRKMVDYYKAKLASQANAEENMKTTLTQMQQELQNHNKVNTENTKLKENLIATTDFLEKQLNVATSTCKDLKDVNAYLENELLEHKNHCKMATRTIETQKQEIKEMNGKMVEIKETYQRQINALEKKLSDTKSRLSKVLGDGFTENNPDIADLSDKNRPTTLAERYQELYDNEWTDAFVAAEKYFLGSSEQFCILTLAKILLTVKQFCEEQHKMQDRELLFALYRTNNPKNQLPSHIRRQFKLFQKNVGEEAIKPIYEKFLESIKSDETAISKFTLTVPQYVNECVALCWLMAIQDPPVVFDDKQQESYMSSKYRAYTQGGDKIAYIVWPALYLHADGPVLMKGVAQCYKSNVDQTMDENSSATSNNLITQETTIKESDSTTTATTSKTGHFRNKDDNLYLKTIMQPHTQVITDTHLYTAKEGQGQHDSNTTNKAVGNTSNSFHSQIEQRQGIGRSSSYIDNQQYQAQGAYYPGYYQPQLGQNNLSGSLNVIYPKTSTFSQHGQ